MDRESLAVQYARMLAMKHASTCAAYHFRDGVAWRCYLATLDYTLAFQLARERE